MTSRLPLPPLLRRKNQSLSGPPRYVSLALSSKIVAPDPTRRTKAPFRPPEFGVLMWLTRVALSAPDVHSADNARNAPRLPSYAVVPPTRMSSPLPPACASLDEPPIR